MSLILPDWVEHHSDTDDKKKRQTIFSIHVHPDGTRLATGGIGECVDECALTLPAHLLPLHNLADQKIRIWATDPILYAEEEANDRVHKLLCTMSRHTGMCFPALAVVSLASNTYPLICVRLCASRSMVAVWPLSCFGVR